MNLRKIMALVSAALVLSFSSLTFAEVQYLRLSQGRVMAYEHLVNNESTKAATLMLLPGVNRALTEKDASVQHLIKQGWNILLPSLTAQPLSIRGLEQFERPYFVSTDKIRVQDFAEDIEALVDSLGLNNVIPVSLSYSSAIAAYLNPETFPHIIETVPLGLAVEGDRQAAAAAELWESWLRLNPFMAPLWIRQSRDTAYKLHWSKIVDSNLLKNPLFYGSAPRVNDIKAGYVTLARATEDFDFTQWNFIEDERTRDFVFAGNEGSERQQNQLLVLQNYLATGKKVRVIVVQGSGHIMPTEHPVLYGAIVGALARKASTELVQFALIDATEDVKSVPWKGRESLESWIRGIQR